MTHIATAFTTQNTLDTYFNQIKDHELLTREQERELANRYRKGHDESAADRLVRANLKLVVKIARDHHINTHRVALSDLIQEGNLGLVHAARKYDPDKQTKFSYYAAYWIKAYIFKHLMDNYSSIKIGTTQAQRKLFFNLKKTREALVRQGVRPTPERIASAVGVKPSEVMEMSERMAHEDRSLNEPSPARSQEEILDNLNDYSASSEEILAQHEMHALLHDILAEFKTDLNQRERDILQRRLLSDTPWTLQRLGGKYGVSRERIRQIEAALIKKLRFFIQKRLPDYQVYQMNPEVRITEAA